MEKTKNNTSDKTNLKLKNSLTTVSAKNLHKKESTYEELCLKLEELIN